MLFPSLWLDCVLQNEKNRQKHNCHSIISFTAIMLTKVRMPGMHLHTTLQNKSPRHLFNIIPTKLRVHNTRYCDHIPPLFKVKHNYFRNSFSLFNS